MTTEELATKDLAEYRAKKQEEALKMSVLDAEAAAKFSTAAALDARDVLSLPTAIITDKLLSAREKSPEGRDASGEGGEYEVGTGTGGGDEDMMDMTPRKAGQGQESMPSVSVSVHDHDQNPSVQFPKHGYGDDNDKLDEYDPEAGYKMTSSSDLPSLRPPPSDPTTTITTTVKEATTPRKSIATSMMAPSIDWASIKAKAVEAGALSERDDDPGNEPPPGGGDQKLAASQQQDRPPPTSSLPSAQDLHRVFAPPPTTSILRPGLWAGDINAPNFGGVVKQFIADAIAGAQDLASLLVGRELFVRGTLSLSKLSSFLSELHRSKHRLAVLGILRPLPSSPPTARESIVKLVHGFASQRRAGVMEPMRGVEVYAIPPSPLATRLLEAGELADGGVAAAAAVARGGSSPTQLFQDQMVLVAVYRKDVQVAAPPGPQVGAGPAGIPPGGPVYSGAGGGGQCPWCQ